MLNQTRLQPGQKVQVIDPEDGYYLDEGEVEQVQGRAVYVRFGTTDTGQQFRAEQLKILKEPAES
jgi:hypothetical protein